jgi:hypothetical protein
MGEIRTALSRNFKEQIAFPSQPRGNNWRPGVEPVMVFHGGI